MRLVPLWARINHEMQQTDVCAIVDDADYEDISRTRWLIEKPGTKAVRARRYQRTGHKTKKIIMMHRQVLGLAEGDPLVDHKDGNGLNNQRSNLRPATVAENGANRSAMANNKCGLKGVSYHKGNPQWDIKNRWIAQIKFGTIRRHLGYYPTPEDAARAYDDAAIEIQGQFARVNYPQHPQ